MTQDSMIERIRNSLASGEELTISDTEFSPNEKLRSKRKLADSVVPFNMQVKDETWQNVNFKNCAIAGLGFSSSVVRNCEFEKCELGIQNWSTRYENVKFTNCDMRSFSFGANEKKYANSFAKVTFEKCKLQGGRANYASFQECIFIDCKFDRMEFPESTLKNSKFIGKIENVVFGRNYTEDPTRIEGCDFNRAEFSYASFPNARVASILPPNSPKNHVVEDFPKMISALDHAIAADPTLGNIPLSTIFLIGHVAGSDFAIINEDDFQELLTAKGFAVMKSLLQS